MEYQQIFDTILAALNAETHFRARRTMEEWILAERECVQREVNRLRGQRGVGSLSLDVIERAERLALGHSDYVRKYAHAAADLVLR